MTAPTEFEWMILSSALLIFVAIVFGLVKYLWNQPLRNGPSYFLGIEVPAGFYEGPGKSWLKSYRAMLIALHLALAVFFGICFAIRRWDLIPLCGFWALLYVASMLAFHAWTRHKLGTNLPVRAVAIAMESRRLSDYIYWPLEALSASIIALSWGLLLHHDGMHIDWLPPLQMTWMALVLPAKILLARSGSPLPAERTEEHFKYQDAMRRNGISYLNIWSWGCLVLLFGVALGRNCSPAVLPWLGWLVGGVFLAVFAYMMIVIFSGIRLAATLGRDLRPTGSFATPFRRAALPKMRRSYLIWFAVWIVPILASSVYAVIR
jgi:hypothetical protein